MQRWGAGDTPLTHERVGVCLNTCSERKSRTFGGTGLEMASLLQALTIGVDWMHL
jgi:hypothetical protein